jgi:hypothetical protein
MQIIEERRRTEGEGKKNAEGLKTTGDGSKKNFRIIF